MMTAPANARISLARLLGIPAERLASNPVITDITLDSRDVVEGSLFLACAGNYSHGLDYLEQALAQGAVAVAWESSIGAKLPSVDTRVPLLEVPQLRRRLGRMAELFFDAPSKKIEVTGYEQAPGEDLASARLGLYVQLWGGRVQARLPEGTGYSASL